MTFLWQNRDRAAKAMRAAPAFLVLSSVAALRVSSRRTWGGAAFSTFLMPSVAAADPLPAVPVDPFNSMCFAV